MSMKARIHVSKNFTIINHMNILEKTLTKVTKEFSKKIRHAGTCHRPRKDPPELQRIYRFHGQILRKPCNKCGKY